MANLKYEHLFVVVLAVMVGTLFLLSGLHNASGASRSGNQAVGPRIFPKGPSVLPADRGLTKQHYLTASPIGNMTCSGGCASKRSACEAACPSGARLCPQACQRAYNYCMGKCDLKKYPR